MPDGTKPLSETINTDYSSMRSNDNQLRKISQRDTSAISSNYVSTFKRKIISMKMICLKLHSNLQGVNELTILNQKLE